jgi:hypothetical protein
MQNGFKLFFVLFQQVQVSKSCEREEDKEEEKRPCQVPNVFLQDVLNSTTLLSHNPHKWP